MAAMSVPPVAIAVDALQAAPFRAYPNGQLDMMETTEGVEVWLA